jgi:hypothetical protein
MVMGGFICRELGGWRMMTGHSPADPRVWLQKSDQQSHTTPQSELASCISCSKQRKTTTWTKHTQTSEKESYFIKKLYY